LPEASGVDKNQVFKVRNTVMALVASEVPKEQKSPICLESYLQ
jgi:hypothetical protein